MAAADLGTAEWERSKITNQDINLLKKLGISKKPKAVCFPSEESYPTPPMGYRILENLRDLMKRRVPLKPLHRHNLLLLLFLRRTKGKGMMSRIPAPPNEEAVPSRQKAAYDPYLETLISSDDEEEVPALMWLLERPMIKELLRIGAQFIGYREYANNAEEKLAEVNERANTLAQKLEQSEEARKKAESDAVQARREADKAKADAADKTSQEFELEDPDNDPLLDAVSFLEFHGTEARDGIDEARTGLSRLFPYFFPKKEEPATFLALAKCFNPPEDLGLKMRHENMKVAVESTVALVADSQQTIDWAKVGDTEQIEQAKWRSLIKAAKLNTKKILSYLGIKPSSTPSSSRPEV
ncbi:hypothetical protein QYE76_053648 [Lolium multiflorum]|uniref:Uncharacterized protein n=1 Tax=Lolium multiflorum TaxID=4521 RepID=A0AAD8SXA3_LOLMU|nr:hypothetical protein QYE76_053648 [Lolium multiflorum]